MILKVKPVPVLAEVLTAKHLRDAQLAEWERQHPRSSRTLVDCSYSLPLAAAIVEYVGKFNVHTPETVRLNAVATLRAMADFIETQTTV